MGERVISDTLLVHLVGPRIDPGQSGQKKSPARQAGRFETEWLATDENLVALTALSGVWIDRVHERKPPKTVVLVMDPSEGPIYGEQEGSA
jgi:hypothetical protein